LKANDGTCPSGTVVGIPDFDLHAPGAQDTVILSGGRQRIASVNIVAATAAFTAFNHVAPQRCHIVLSAQSIISGNVDPNPSNNVFPVEISVLDANDPEETPVHETFMSSVRPALVRINHGQASGAAHVTIGAGNADLTDPDGHADMVNGAVGGCPPGILGTTNFGSAALGPPNTVAVPAGSIRYGKLTVTANAADFHSPSIRSPARCVAMVTTTGPTGDTDATNNSSMLVVDVVDHNDF